MNLLSKKQALAVTYTRTIPLWLRYVDDTFTAVCKDEIDDFHEHLNRRKADIQLPRRLRKIVRLLSFHMKKNAKNSKLMLIPHCDHDAVS